ncbi:testis-expressed protein 36 [Osmerus eperlanus]|uniref:testis-expressed protein 36 n=1 Tax=Osmerus eperlanus TaxID=29151 RepID=UPI002E0E5E9C
MTKGGKRYSIMENDGKWFTHTDVSVTETTRQEACTSTRPILNKNTGISYPFSAHDNRSALQGNIQVFDDGLGRKKCLDERRQQNSSCLRNHGDVNGSGMTKGDFSAYHTDYPDSLSSGSATFRRFPRNHLEKSTAAASALEAESFMWFGRHDLDHPLPLGVLGATNCSSTSKTKDYPHNQH